jgi:hypothetical protein
MSIDRYLNVVHELWYRQYRKPKYTLIICILIWIGKMILYLLYKISHSLLASSIFMFPYDYVLRSNNDKSINQSSITHDCNVNNNGSFFSSCLFTFGFYYVLPLSIIGISYSRVVIHIRNHRRRISRLFVSNHMRKILIIILFFLVSLVILINQSNVNIVVSNVFY